MKLEKKVVIIKMSSEVGKFFNQKKIIIIIINRKLIKI